jgi:hypothetical protein
MGPRVSLNVLEKKEFLAAARIQTSNRQTRCLIAILTVLFRLPQIFNHLIHFRGIMLLNLNAHHRRFQYPCYVTVRFVNR